MEAVRQKLLILSKLILNYVITFAIFILGLSHLISFSISEDRYGVVQKDLSEVISILFALEKVSYKSLFLQFAQWAKNGQIVK